MSGQVEKNSTLGIAYATVEELSEELFKAHIRIEELERGEDIGESPLEHRCVELLAEVDFLREMLRLALAHNTKPEGN